MPTNKSADGRLAGIALGHFSLNDCHGGIRGTEARQESSRHSVHSCAPVTHMLLVLRMLLRRQRPMMGLPVGFSLFCSHLVVTLAHGLHVHTVTVMHGAVGACLMVMLLRLSAAGQEQSAGSKAEKGGQEAGVHATSGKGEQDALMLRAKAQMGLTALKRCCGESGAA